jgi:hypothetical protein
MAALGIAKMRRGKGLKMQNASRSPFYGVNPLVESHAAVVVAWSLQFTARPSNLGQFKFETSTSLCPAV